MALRHLLRLCGSQLPVPEGAPDGTSRQVVVGRMGDEAQDLRFYGFYGDFMGFSWWFHGIFIAFHGIYWDNLGVESSHLSQTSRRTWHRPMIVQKLLFRCGAGAISCGKRPSKKNIRFTVVCNPYRVLCCKTRRTNKVAFSLHRMRDLTASPVAVSKSKPVCSHLHG